MSDEQQRLEPEDKSRKQLLREALLRAEMAEAIGDDKAVQKALDEAADLEEDMPSFRSLADDVVGGLVDKELDESGLRRDFPPEKI